MKDCLPEVTTAPLILSSCAILSAASAMSSMNSLVMTFMGLPLTSTVTIATPSASTLKSIVSIFKPSR